MEQSTYSLPNFFRAIYKKTSNSLWAFKINDERFYQYCLAVLLFTCRKYVGSLPGTGFSQDDEATLAQLCKLGFATIKDHESEGSGELLVGLSPTLSEEPIDRIELLINHFAKYHVLKDNFKKFPSGEQEYNSACNNFENLRSEFGVPGRFRYNKFIRRDNPLLRGGIMVSIPKDESVIESVDSMD